MLEEELGPLSALGEQFAEVLALVDLGRFHAALRVGR